MHETCTEFCWGNVLMRSRCDGSIWVALMKIVWRMWAGL